MEPGWWKGIHGELKIRCPQGHVGSNPTPGTNHSYLRRIRPVERAVGPRSNRQLVASPAATFSAAL